MRYAAHINDTNITLLSSERILYREPGFALLEDGVLITGSEAFARARIDPRGVQHRYWLDLTTAPLADRRFGHLSAAELASWQLEQLWRTAGEVKDGSLVLAVPAYMESAHLGLLLGIATELGLPVVALVDAAVAATRREYRDAVPVHVDIGLHATTLTRLAQSGQVSVDRTEVLRDCGLYAMYDAWINAVAEAFVRQSRFDPLHTAETEQMLLDSLGEWLAEATHADRVQLKISFRGLSHEAEIDALSLVGAAAPYYQLIASKLRALYRAEDTPAIQVTDRITRLPGLAEMLKARVGGEVFTLEPGATARGALARCREAVAAKEGVSLRRQLPWDQAAVTVKSDSASHGKAGTPTHLLFGSIAYAIDAAGLVLGSQTDSALRSILLGSDMPGISRRHCSLRRVNGQCVLEDHSRYGTFLNGHRIDGSTVLQVGDSLRLGSPGYELQLITTAEPGGVSG